NDDVLLLGLGVPVEPLSWPAGLALTAADLVEGDLSWPSERGVSPAFPLTVSLSALFLRLLASSLSFLLPAAASSSFLSLLCVPSLSLSVSPVCESGSPPWLSVSHTFCLSGKLALDLAPWSERSPESDRLLLR